MCVAAGDPEPEDPEDGVCQQPADQDDGTWTCHAINGALMCSMSCKKKHTLFGPSAVTCDYSTGKWSNDGLMGGWPHCVKTNDPEPDPCQQPADYEGGTWDCNGINGAILCGITCGANYSLMGPSAVTCDLTTGKWSNDGLVGGWPMCVLTDDPAPDSPDACRKPDDVAGGDWDCRALNFVMMCGLTCTGANYSLKGPSSVTCNLSTGKWSNDGNVGGWPVCVLESGKEVKKPKKQKKQKKEKSPKNKDSKAIKKKIKKIEKRCKSEPDHSSCTKLAELKQQLNEDRSNNFDLMAPDFSHVCGERRGSKCYKREIKKFCITNPSNLFCL